ncbi:hypothetical protein BH10PAT3_BH10PAT3_7540 [soil metagenome]
MINTKEFVGLGVALNLNIGTAPWKYLRADLIQQAINPIDVAKSHATIIDSKEMDFEISDVESTKKIATIREEVQKYMASLQVNKLLLIPVSERVKPFSFNRKKVGVIFGEEEQAYFADVRADLSDIYYEIAGVTLIEERPYIAHTNLGNKTAEYRERRKIEGAINTELPAAPKVFAVTGYSIEERIVCTELEEAQEIPNLNLRYRNTPPSLRSAS